MGADNTPTTDLSQTHLKTTHVIAIVLAIISAGATVGIAYMNLTWEVRSLSDKQREIPTREDLSKAKTELSVDLTHAASERVKFYMEHALLECTPPVRGQKQHCQLVWPLPNPPN